MKQIKATVTDSYALPSRAIQHMAFINPKYTIYQYHSRGNAFVTYLVNGGRGLALPVHHTARPAGAQYLCIWICRSKEVS